MIKKSKTLPSKKKTKENVSVKNSKLRKLVHPGKSFPIVGIGASAGGLEAIKELLAKIPPNSNMAYVVVQHLDPKHESMSAEIFSRITKLPICKIKNKMQIKPNKIFAIPANSTLSIKNGQLLLSPRLEINLPIKTIDLFFESLAIDQGHLAVGIVLSGTGSDGSEGLEAIKVQGGITFAQDPKTAKFKDMPKNAIAMGVVDFVCPPEKMVKELIRVASINDNEKLIFPIEKKDEILKQIFSLLSNSTNVDFTHYKINTIQRRIARRMLITKSPSLSTYGKFLENNEAEIQSLYEDLLIHVTSFFRDPKYFENLKNQILPKYFKLRNLSAPYRIWVPGCSTGQEAYSLIITILEFLEENFQNKVLPPITLFGTDISEAALAIARKGIYPESISKEISFERLDKYFDKIPSGYRIAKHVREMCMFSKHDVTSDPPFAKIDLISCRNLLIYFDTELQKKIFPIFHFALSSHGILFLGKSESVGQFSNLFTQSSKTSKIFSKVNIKTPFVVKMPIDRYSVERLESRYKKISDNPESRDIQKEFEKMAMAEFTPPSVIINSAMEIIQSNGKINPFIQLSQGLASLNLLKMTPPELAADLRAAFLAVKKKNATIKKECFCSSENAVPRKINITIAPFPSNKLKQEELYTIFFDESKTTKTPHKIGGIKKLVEETNHKHHQEMRRKIAENQEYQQSLIEEYETSQGELLSANEELQSANEELQSSNEELETAKEELQSTNEELTTVNDELLTRNTEMTELNSKLNNATEELKKSYEDAKTIIESQPIPLLVIQSNFKIKIANEIFYDTFKVTRQETEGKLISELGSGQWRVPELEKLINQTLMKGISFDHFQVTNIFPIIGQKTMQLSSRKVQLVGSKEYAALLTIEDITARLSIENSLKNSEEKYRNLISNAYDGVIIVNKDGLIEFSNQRVEELFGYKASELINRPVELLIPNRFKDEHVNNRLNFFAHPASRGMGTNREIFAERKNGTEFPVDISLSPIKTDHDVYVTAVIRDVSERKVIERNQENILLNERKANQLKDEFLATLSHELRTPLTTILAWAQIIKRSNYNLDKVKRGIDILERSAKNQEHLIEDLLDITRIESGKLNLTIQKIDPKKILNTAIESVQNQALSKSIQIIEIIQPNIKHIYADPNRMQQVLWNLISNAIKFTPQNGHIWIKMAHVSSVEGERIQIIVRDDGKGISPKFIPMIFERFTQEDSSKSRPHGGLGLGLSIVRKLIEMHNGTISVESAGENLGTTFTILIPLKNKLSENINSIVSSTVDPNLKKGLEHTLLNGVKVLLVEDDLDTKEIIMQMIQSFGAQVSTASSASEAMILFNLENPDIIVSDLSMPIEDGLSLIKRIRNKDINIPALALTELTSGNIVQKALKSGFQATFSKPINDANKFGIVIAKLVNKINPTTL